jgi:GNAT superfamily N-acetyltransferase
MGLELKLAYDSPEVIGTLFEEYTNMLIDGDSTFEEYLRIQNYDEELKHLESKYGLPFGRLYLAYYDNQLAGCIGLKRIDEKNCEMKRLFVKPEFRGKQIGNKLVRAIIEDAKAIKYEHMLLDTLPFLKSAIRMYKEMGFYEIDSYNNSPMGTSIYMKLDLNI